MYVKPYRCVAFVYSNQYVERVTTLSHTDKYKSEALSEVMSKVYSCCVRVPLEHAIKIRCEQLETSRALRENSVRCGRRGG